MIEKEIDSWKLSSGPHVQTVAHVLWPSPEKYVNVCKRGEGEIRSRRGLSAVDA